MSSVSGCLVDPDGQTHALASTRIRAKLQNKEYTILGNQWPIFLWKNSQYDSNNPWNGFLCSKLLVSVSQRPYSTEPCKLIYQSQAFKHMFISPSSVEQALKATCLGNARLHGMTKVNVALLVYIATQVFPPHHS